MKIIHVIPSLDKGGAERLAADICKELSQREGVKVKLVTFRKDNAYSGSLKGMDVETVPAFVIPSITSKTRADVSRWMTLLDEFKPDIIHSHLFESEMVTRYELRREPVYVTHCHDNMAQLKKFSIQTVLSKKALTNFYERQIMLKRYRACDNHFLCISNNNYRYITSVLPPSLRRNAHLFHNAIHYKKFSVANSERSIAPVRMVNTGSFIPLKNQILLVEVLKELKARGIPATVSFLGDGPTKEMVQRKVVEYGLTDHVTFAGNVEQVENYLREANLYVHTSYSEAFGLVLVEAMAAGLPVITLDGGGNRDLIQEGKNGYLLDKQDAALFADKIATLMSNEPLYRTMTRNAAEFAKGFNMPNYVDRLLDLYRQWLKEKNS